MHEKDHPTPSCRSAEDLWQELGGRIKAFIRQRIDHQQDVEDLLQEVFLKIHQEACSVKDREKAQAWVYRIARNTVVDHYRAKGRGPRAGELPLELAEQSPADEIDAGDVHEEVLSWLEPMIQNLPSKYSQALRLADIEGLTQQQVADRLGLSLSGAKSRVQRARVQLGEMLQACCRIELGMDGRVVEYRRNQ